MRKGERYRINLKQKFLIFIQEFFLLLLITSPLLFYLFCRLLDLDKGFLFVGGLIFFTFLSILSIYGAFVESRFIVIKRNELDIKGLKKKFRIVYFTDLHVGPFKKSKFVKRVVKKVNSLRADLIFVGGDFTTGEDFHPKYLTPLGKLEANYPIVAVLGNHDYNVNFPWDNRRPELAKKVTKKLRALKIKVLRNKSYQFEFGKEVLNVVGIDDLWAKRDDVEKAFEEIETKHPTIVFVHNPDLVKKLKDKRVDIVFAGHTHGNVVRFPFDGPIFPFIRAIKLKAKYLKGFHKFRGIPIYITSGLGESVTRIRLFNPPEIVIFDLK